MLLVRMVILLSGLYAQMRNLLTANAAAVWRAHSSKTLLKVTKLRNEYKRQIHDCAARVRHQPLVSSMVVVWIGAFMYHRQASCDYHRLRNLFLARSAREIGAGLS
jgi:hypothetical protein